MNLNHYFDKIYCINLDRRKDRWEESLKEFEKWGLFNYIERYSAIDGSKIKNEDKNNILKDGEIGILLTHFEIIKEAKEKKYNNILIIEDDIEFSEKFKDFKSYYEVTPKNWDMIYFGGNHNVHMGKKINMINDKIIKLDETYGIHCIAIRDTLYDFILEIIKDKKKPIDVYYAILQKSFNCYGFYPSLALQRVSYSDIQNKIVNYKWLF